MEKNEKNKEKIMLDDCGKLAMLYTKWREITIRTKNINAN